MRDPVNQYHSPEADTPTAEDSTDRHIIDRLFARSEEGLTLLQTHYGKLCHRIALNLLGSREDAEECVNDTYLHAWNAIPPQRPQFLSAFLAKITRNLAISRYRANHRDKRGKGRLTLALDELEYCLPDRGQGNLADDLVLRQSLNDFLHALPEPARGIFLRRYWYVRSVAEIARELGMKESRVKMILHRTREKLRVHLHDAGIEV